MEKTILFIDGGYLSFISKHFGGGNPLKYKIEKFAINLAKEVGLDCQTIYFYIAPPFQGPKPSEEENRRKANYDKFIEKLKFVEPQIKIREGRLQKINETFQQKGVDTLMTMDLLKVAQQKEIKKIIILTSDTDFVPIIKDIRKNYGIEVILAYFTDRKRKSAFSLSNHLWKAVNRKILIKRKNFDNQDGTQL
ncbi:MAG: NYN domain-containing protein [Nanoarchaeota archaeon]